MALIVMAKKVRGREEEEEREEKAAAEAGGRIYIAESVDPIIRGADRCGGGIVVTCLHYRKKRTYIYFASRIVFRVSANVSRPRRLKTQKGYLYRFAQVMSPNHLPYPDPSCFLFYIFFNRRNMRARHAFG